ncbi:MAG TPA: hypothetical protein VLU25_16980 [Acidobacteriota bacterium]|nr:hypothetical protein [Acidobacteriota bacterium]
MKKMRLVFLLAMLAAMTLAGLESMVAPAEVSAGVWDEVCCGSGCSEDFCIGDGPYTCCKGEVEVQ